MDELVRHAIALKKSDPRQALNIFEEIVEKRGKNGFLLGQIGHCLLILQDLKGARASLEESLSLDPNNIYPRYFLATVASREGKTKEQIELLSDNLKYQPSDLFSRRELVRACTKAKRIDEANFHADWLLENDSNNVSSLKSVYLVKLLFDDKDKARAILKKIISISPDDSYVISELVKLSDKDAQSKLSEISLLLKLPNNQKNPKLLTTKIQILISEKKFEEAGNIARELLDQFPDDIYLKRAVIKIFIECKFYEDAMQVIFNFLKLNPNDYYLHNTLIKLSKEGVHDKVYDLYTQLIEFHPNEYKLLGRRMVISSICNPPLSKEVSHSKPNSDVIGEALSKYFKISKFRPGQEAVIKRVMNGESLLLVMPTGHGKSLCFQLPALIKKRLTIVISPLISLMKDQVEELNKKGIGAAALNSSFTIEEQDRIIKDALEGKYLFIYLAPERLRSNKFRDILPRLNPAFVVIDEAHCISQWGHDFRPDYLMISNAIRECGNPQIIAATATATPDVQKDIIHQIKRDGMKSYIAGFERTNLIFSVTSVKNEDDKQRKLISRLKKAGGSTIVYCSTRKAVKELTTLINESGLKAKGYHAGLQHEERSAIQDEFMQGAVPTIVATNAFGMGIDKSNIRTIIHYQVPGSIEAYYQEAGRAGRDGELSHCELFFFYPDKEIHEFFIDGSNPSPVEVRDVYRFLSRIDSGARTIQISSREIAKELSIKSDMSVNSALALLERVGVIERENSSQPYAIKLTDHFLMSPPGEKAAIQHRLWQWIKAESNSGKERTINVDLQAIAKESLLDIDQTLRGLNALNDKGLILFSQPFRGREILIKKRMHPSELLLDEKAMMEKRIKDEEKLRDMLGYGFSKGCRQRHIVKYFGATSKPCGHCDMCRGRR